MTLAKHKVHADYSSLWMTPEANLVPVREVLGRIDLDPASSAEANLRVQATDYFDGSPGRCGLTEDWFGRVFLNPPYGRGVTERWVQKAIDEYAEGRADEVVMLLPANIDVGWFHELLWGSMPLCFTRGRIRFIRPGGEVGPSNQGGSVYAYLGPAHKHIRFQFAFRPIGHVVLP